MAMCHMNVHIIDVDRKRRIVVKHLTGGAGAAKVDIEKRTVIIAAMAREATKVRMAGSPLRNLLARRSIAGRLLHRCIDLLSCQKHGDLDGSGPGRAGRQ